METHQFTGSHIVVEASTNDVEATGFAAHNPRRHLSLRQGAKHQGPQAVAIAQAIERLRRSDHKAEGPLALTGCRFDRLIPIETGFHLRLNSEGNQLAIGGAGGLTTLLLQLITQLHGIDQIAVVGQGKGTQSGHQDQGLGVAHPGTSGCGIPRMTNRQIAGHALQHVLIKHLADQAHVFVQANPIALKDSNTSGFLAAVLQGVEPEITKAGNLLA